MFGSLDSVCRGRLEAVLDNPTEETWDEAYSLIVGKDGFTTLWQAWVQVDPDAPRFGPSEDFAGKRIHGWASVPDQLTLYRALREVTQ
jgi:hypothetical protein